MNWKELEIFKGIDLNDSFILSWSSGSKDLTFLIEASIWPESKYYEKPKIDEYTCYKPARLSFHNFTKITGLLNATEVQSSVDANDVIDFGNIDHLEKNSEGYIIVGDFGHVVISGGEMKLEVNDKGR